MSRELAYSIVQEVALHVSESGGDFRAELAARLKARPDHAVYASLFSPEPYLKHVDTIFARVFGRTE